MCRNELELVVYFFSDSRKRHAAARRTRIKGMNHIFDRERFASLFLLAPLLATPCLPLLGRELRCLTPAPKLALHRNHALTARTKQQTLEFRDFGRELLNRGRLLDERRR